MTEGKQSLPSQNMFRGFFVGWVDIDYFKLGFFLGGCHFNHLIKIFFYCCSITVVPISSPRYSPLPYPPPVPYSILPPLVFFLVSFIPVNLPLPLLLN